ncbi:MAG: GAF domain-containing protein [Gemmatimonas sp.]|uniref:GAF domain-containing protein n=1 Tax=Gemmatimonas sp. TaxID=1962908 RepID=UPI0022C18033|nr:GAF domain-containing protein [Gemmatimonas sp.]MCZ8012401.1 GAF domain-containing protein [Gemmatimonas sp.]MCZ8266670.1 GAF domain-containing protein [Gemmatimonas sp.]
MIEWFSGVADRWPKRFRYGSAAFAFLCTSLFSLIAAGELGNTSPNRWWSFVPLVFFGFSVWVRDEVLDRQAFGMSERARKAFVIRLLHVVRLATQVEITGRGKSRKKALRLCVMCPTSDGARMKVWVSENMEGDGDRQMEIDAGTGVAGWVYTNRKNAVVDRQAYPQDPRAAVSPPHAAAAVRPEARSIMCILILDPHHAALPAEDRKVVGVLCCDSDLEAKSAGFYDNKVIGLLTQTADLVAATLVQA